MFCILIHVGGNHWCSIICYMQEKKIEYFDSYGTKNIDAIMNIKKYIEKLSTLCQEDFDTREWACVCSKRIPIQKNTYDCGVFMLQCLRSVLFSPNYDPSFTEEDIPKFRITMMFEILCKKLFEDSELPNFLSNPNLINEVHETNICL